MPDEGYKLTQALGTLSKHLDKVVKTANALIIKSSVKQEYKQDLETDFTNVKVFNSDVSNNLAEQINEFVDTSTNGQIKNIELDFDSVCILMNAIALEDVWKDQFDDDCTNKIKFNIDDNKKEGI